MTCLCPSHDQLVPSIPQPAREPAGATGCTRSITDSITAQPLPSYCPCIRPAPAPTPGTCPCTTGTEPSTWLPCPCRCVAGDVFLQPLAGKFIKLVLQLLARYHTWLERGLAQRAAHDPQAGAEQVWSTPVNKQKRKVQWIWLGLSTVASLQSG